MNEGMLLPGLVAIGLLTITPGADTFLVLRNALSGGIRGGFATTAGIASGTMVHATLSAIGLSVVLTRSASAFHAVKLIGAAYLLYVGVRSLRRALTRREPRDGKGPDAPLGAPGDAARAFREGFLTNLLNPKVAVFYLAFFPQLVDPGGPVLAMSLLLGLAHNAMGLVWLGAISIAVSTARRFIVRSAIRRSLDALSGCALSAFGVRLALSSR